VLLQVLVVTSQSCDILAQQHAFNRITSVPVVPLYSHFRSARHAAFWRRVSLVIHLFLIEPIMIKMLSQFYQKYTYLRSICLKNVGCLNCNIIISIKQFVAYISICMPILLYGLEACPLTKSDLCSLDFVINSLFIKLFKTSDMEIVKYCQSVFNFVIPSVQIAQ